MPPLAQAGYHVVSYDQRGYGRTTGWDSSPWDKTNLAEFRVSQLVRDALSLVNRLGRKQVDCIVGHDFGGVTAAACPVMRPDVFKSAVHMSHPFHGSATLPFGPEGSTLKPGERPHDADIGASLAALSPPRKHYKLYNSTQAAAHDWDHPEQGLKEFLRGYIHLKSAKWAGNKPFSLAGFTAPELAQMPNYYILPLDKTMGQAVADMMAGEDATASEAFLNDAALDIYVQEWSRTGFQGGLNWYRSATTPAVNRDDSLLFANKKIEVPCTFISGAQDWGNYQEPGAVENYAQNCTDFRGTTLIEGAGHWPQQEQPEAVARAIIAFLKDAGI
ncbi:hypothetical protein FH972_025112 [Carpinus fangiana]|uniref:AB hydrolase-1 domain-containing protein n=1 Tax=Carpinus fangiana TaxID=176857 RepID=A0A5N6L2L6_9ROSI|nr:hypothetical protein FH972_025112 [Carpinus fangiana]